MTIQKAGGLAALFEAAAFILGFWVFLVILGPARYGAADIAPGRHVAFLVANRDLLTAWNLVIYIAFGAALVVLALALHDRLRSAAPALAAIGAAFGLIWAGLVIACGMVANIGITVIAGLAVADPVAAAATWLSYKIVIGGLGGGNEIVGGLWILLVGLAAWRARALPRLLAGLAMVVGAAGLLTTIPALAELGSVFGLGLILWFGWAGAILLRGPRRPVPAASQ